ncbi:extracellular solute-binding protein [Metabacillus niabensis]|uniref:Aldouronate transport system substrate-binding protein n=1 Tax=Metabacillus niabensis TaxID=324854 RepID=A0ABT9Z1U0_9BACI|nr:extracellular solute-binding protein [Metabacillus niabensis]MDQ0226172.1 putative aldouronate transport system substrate-binding protein [Metabacillus niabensis]
MVNRKSLVLFLSLMLLLSVVTACSNKESSGQEEGKVFTYTFFNASSTGKDVNTGDTKIGKMFEEATGVNFNIEHIVGDSNQKIGTMIASGEYPELLNAQNATNDVIDAGGFVPLNDLIEEHAPNLRKLYDPIWEKMKHEDGNIYILPSGVSNGYIKPPNVGQSAFWIKRDALKEQGYPHPKTIDEFFEIVEKYAKAHPKTNGADTIPYTLLQYDWHVGQLFDPPAFLSGEQEGIIVDDKTLEVSVYHNKDMTKRWLKILNEINDKGLFDREAFTQNYDEYLAKISSGRVVGWFGPRWESGTALDTLEQDDDPYNDYMGFPIVFEDGIKDQYLNPESFVTSPGMGLTTGTPEEDQVRIIKFLDHMAKIDSQKLITWGIEGETYEVNEEGRFIRTQEQIDLVSKEEFRDEFGFTALGWYWPIMSGTFDDGNSVDPAVQPEVAQLAYDEVDKEFLKAYNIETFTDLFTEPDPAPWFPFWDATIETGSEAQLYDQQSRDLIKRSYPDIILADPANFEKEWNKFKKEFDKLPYEAYEDVIEASVKKEAELMSK